MRRIWKTFKDFALPFVSGLGRTALVLITTIFAAAGGMGLAITLINPVNLWWELSIGNSFLRDWIYAGSCVS